MSLDMAAPRGRFGVRPITLGSVIERRLLVNYRVDPDVAAAVLPQPLRPLTVGGWAVAGICMIRLAQVRPAPVPAAIGLRSENAAHRIAVQWDGPDGPRSGVYIPRRDTGSVLNLLAGGRLFPGVHHLASFQVHESADEVKVAFAARDGQASAAAHVRVTGELAHSTLFADLAQASQFFLTGSVGLSPARDGAAIEAVELVPAGWQLQPAELVAIRSSYFDDLTRFPEGTAVPDCVLLMRNVPVTWRSAGTFRRVAASPATPEPACR
jgi:uncharacterized protein YqjF (DUF2071 family)